MSEYNCDDCVRDCAEVVNSPCRNGLIEDFRQLQAENEYLKKVVIDLRFLSGTCIDKVSIESQIREKTDLAAELEYELKREAELNELI